MANVSRVNGFRPVKHMTGAPYNGQANIYEVPAGEAIPVMIGDLVKLSDSAATAGYVAVESITTVTTANTAGIAAVAVVGVVVGIVNNKLDIDGKMTTGSVSLDIPIYRAASTKQFVMVCDAPDIVCEVEATASVALADIGLLGDIGWAAQTAAGGNGTSTQQLSTTAIDTTATRPLQVIGMSKRIDNEPASANNKVLVRFNTHQYGAAGLASV
jgi:hypothetical protein